MKPRRLLAALLLALALPGLAATPAKAGASGELTVFYYDRPPFFGDVDGKPAGLLIDTARQRLETARIRYRFVNVPVVRFFEELKKPGNACVLGALRTKEREATYTYADDFIYRDLPFQIIINRAKREALPVRPTIRQILESDLRLGLSEGYVYGEWLDGKLAEHSPPLYRVNVGNQSERMHLMLVAGRFDYMFSVAEEARYVVTRTAENREHLTTVEIADAPQGNRRYLLCSKGIDGALMRRINDAVATLKADPGTARATGTP